MMKYIVVLAVLLVSGCGASSIQRSTAPRTESYQHVELQDPCQGPLRLQGLRTSGVEYQGITWYCN